MAPDKAVKAMDMMIEARPEAKGEDQYCFILSLEVAQALYTYHGMISGKLLIARSGDEFQWKGFKCKVT